MRRALTVLLLAAGVLAVTGCGGRGASGQDVERTRAEVRDAAEQELPALVEELGGGVVRADGRYDLEGLKDDVRLVYRVEAQLLVDRGRSADVTGALEGLGYTITQDAAGTVVGERDDLRYLVATSDDGDLRVTLEGPQLRIPEEDRPASRPHEQLDLPASVMVPAPERPRQGRSDGTGDG
ncbi:hypothetical protein [Cellulomonas telluris]|uniref:hypothetical protein n=1 Tax=Cellulomonas telluris TaxID=2306636 RepID=UPI0010A8E65C|nr:hypothetical protein [Cellulomonas telluris]